MAEKLKIQICSEIPTLNEDNDQEEKYILKYKEKFKCNIWKSKKCHPNSPKLSKQEIIKINEKMNKLKTKRKLKECNGRCLFCTKSAEITNKYITENNAKIEEVLKEKDKIKIEEKMKEEDIIMDEPNTNPQIPAHDNKPNINELVRIETRGDGNCLPRAILQQLELNQEKHLLLRHEISKSILEFDIDKDILKALNYDNKNELAKEILKPNKFIGYLEITPFLIKYNLKCNIYLEDNPLKGNKWISLNDKSEENNNQEQIYLSYHQGKYEHLEAHFTCLKNPVLQATQFKSKINALIEGDDKEKEKIPINLMIWNIDSINTPTKRGYLLEFLYEKNIQICLLQETMLKQGDKMYLKVFKIYRADSDIRRKGVAILISNELDCTSYITEKDDEGRYIQVKLKNQNSYEEFLISSVYIEPTNERNKHLIPDSIWDSEHFGGDLNNMNTGLPKIEKVYHIKNTGKLIETKKVPNSLSDHPILIFQIETPIKKKNDTYQITILNKNTIKENIIELNKTTNQIYTQNIKDPRMIKNKKIHEISLLNEKYIEEFEELKAKEKEKEKFKQIKIRNIQEISSLLKSQSLGKEPFQRLTHLMQLNNKNIWWKPESETEKEMVIKGFIELYQSNQNIIEQDNINLINLILQSLEVIIQDKNSTNIPPPAIPKSEAKDINGFGQKEIMKIIVGNNLKETSQKLKNLIHNTSNSENKSLLFNNTSKIILKKKKDYIESWKDLRAITITPAIIMIHDKILLTYIRAEIDSIFSKKQHGARPGLSTNTAKLNIIFNANKKGLKYCMLLDLTKAFDKINREELRKIIKSIKNKNISTWLEHILDIYEIIIYDIKGRKIYPTTGAPQGTVFGPILFLTYINPLLNIIQETYPQQDIQAFMDDLILIASNKEELQKMLETTHQYIINNKMELNLSKCEHLSAIENDTIIDPLTRTIFYSQPTAKYLGQHIDNEGKPTNIINEFNFSEISNIIKTSTPYITRRAKLKLFSTYIKSKFQHLLPLISLQGNLDKTWSNIRKSLFKEIIDFSTMPRESGSLIGISFYSIIIKPLLKLYKKEYELNDEEMIEFMKES